MGNAAPTASDDLVLDKLAEATTLYERYLEITRVAHVPAGAFEEADTFSLPPRTDLPLTLDFNTNR